MAGSVNAPHTYPSRLRLLAPATTPICLVLVQQEPSEQWIISNPFDFVESELTYALEGGDDVNGNPALLTSAMKVHVNL